MFKHTILAMTMTMKTSLNTGSTIAFCIMSSTTVKTEGCFWIYTEIDDNSDRGRQNDEKN